MRALLIISDVLRAADLGASPFNLAPEEVLLTGYEYLGYLGTGKNRFVGVLLHQPPEHLLPKLALGLRDQPPLEALWNLLNQGSRLPVRVLVPAPCRPLPAWFQLGLEPIIPADCREWLHNLIETSPRSENNASAPRAAGYSTSHAAGNEPPPAKGLPAGHATVMNTPPDERRPAPLTADDVRELFQQGRRRLNAGQPMTDWARETADSLGMSVVEASRRYRLLRLDIRSRRDLVTKREQLHALALADDKLLFVVPAPFWPAFSEMMPSLRSRLVAPSIFVEEKGAFTGEISLDMVSDAGCRGAILPSAPVYTRSKQMKAFLERAVRKGILIFSPAPLESGTGCVIIPLHGDRGSLKDSMNPESFDTPVAEMIEEGLSSS
ncbi:MAG: triose-phosphate isomerase [Candidatus Ozemobacteraceae bacterium]